MIFAAFGTSMLPFTRLLQKLKELAPYLNEELVVQAGYTPGKISGAKVFQFSPELKSYYREARIVVVHAGLGIQQELIEIKKPFIAIPRLAKYHEHYDNHQLETCEMLFRKYGVKYLVDLNELTPELLKTYRYTPEYSDSSLKSFRERILPVLFSR